MMISSSILCVSPSRAGISIRALPRPASTFNLPAAGQLRFSLYWSPLARRRRPGGSERRMEEKSCTLIGQLNLIKRAVGALVSLSNHCPTVANTHTHTLAASVRFAHWLNQNRRAKRFVARSFERIKEKRKRNFCAHSFARWQICALVCCFRLGRARAKKQSEWN